MASNESRSPEERAYTWKGQLQVGEDGELVVMQWLRSRGLGVEDLRSNREYQKDDVDLKVWESGVSIFLAEVKTDTYNNDYVFFETHTKEKTPGALFKTRARVMYIYKPKRGEIFEIEPARVTTHLFTAARQLGGTYYNLFPVFNDKKRVRAFGVKLSYAELTTLGGVLYSIPQRTVTPEEARRDVASQKSVLDKLAEQDGEYWNDQTDSQDPSGIDRGV